MGVNHAGLSCLRCEVSVTLSSEIVFPPPRPRRCRMPRPASISRKLRNRAITAPITIHPPGVIATPARAEAEALGRRPTTPVRGRWSCPRSARRPHSAHDAECLRPTPSGSPVPASRGGGCIRDMPHHQVMHLVTASNGSDPGGGTERGILTHRDGPPRGTRRMALRSPNTKDCKEL